MDTCDDPFVSIQAEVKAHLAGVPDVIPPSLGERFLAAVETQVGPLPPQLSVTGATIRAHCQWCGGRGCLVCGLEQERVYRQQFPQGPQPLLTVRRDDRHAMQMLGEVLRVLMETAPPEGGTP